MSRFCSILACHVTVFCFCRFCCGGFLASCFSLSSERSYSGILHVWKTGGCFLRDACCKHSHKHTGNLVFFGVFLCLTKRRASKVCARQKMSNIAGNKDVAFWNLKLIWESKRSAPGWDGLGVVYSLVLCHKCIFSSAWLCKFPLQFFYWNANKASDSNINEQISWKWFVLITMYNYKTIIKKTFGHNSWY